MDHHVALTLIDHRQNILPRDRLRFRHRFSLVPEAIKRLPAAFAGDLAGIAALGI